MRLSYIVPFLILQSQAWRPTDHSCGFNRPCLTSFRWEDDWNKRETFYPENVYPRYRLPSETALPALIWDREYNISWTTNDPSLPVTVWWIVDFLEDKPSPESSSVDGRLWGITVRNVTSTTFKPSLDMFPSGTMPNTSNWTAEGLASSPTHILISQFREGARNDTWGLMDSSRQDYSDRFTVITESTRLLIVEARLAEERAWRRKLTTWVTVGTVLGAFFAAIVTWSLTALWARMSRKKRAGKGLG